MSSCHIIYIDSVLCFICEKFKFWFLKLFWSIWMVNCMVQECKLLIIQGNQEKRTFFSFLWSWKKCLDYWYCDSIVINDTQKNEAWEIINKLICSQCKYLSQWCDHWACSALSHYFLSSTLFCFMSSWFT